MIHFLFNYEKMKYTNLSEGEAFIQIFINNFLPLYNSIMSETDLGFDVIKFSQEINPQILFVLQQVAAILQKIYMVLT